MFANLKEEDVPTILSSAGVVAGSSTSEVFGQRFLVNRHDIIRHSLNVICSDNRYTCEYFSFYFPTKELIRNYFGQSFALFLIDQYLKVIEVSDYNSIKNVWEKKYPDALQAGDELMKVFERLCNAGIR